VWQRLLGGESKDHPEAGERTHDASDDPDALVAVAVVPLPAPAHTVEFKLLPRYSVATFKSEAPLETFLGHSSDVAGGIQGSLSVDPARPQGGKATVRVDMTLVRTGIEKRHADMRGKPYLQSDVEANRWVTFQVTKVEVAGPLEPGKTVPAKIHGLPTVKNKPVEKVADATLARVLLVERLLVA